MPDAPDAPDAEHETTFSLGAIVAAVAVVILGLGAVGWGAASAMAGAHRTANLEQTQQMVGYVPATYRPQIPRSNAPLVVAPPMGNWTPDRGREIAQRALSWLNWPYSFGGGGADGPSYGVAVDHDSRHDPRVRGFDCSGLAMYALAPWLTSLDHDAAKQYNEVGTWHPALSTLQVGDLIFWSKDGTIGGIGHVAIYVGNGEVVQAPQSGDVIRITPIYEVEPGDMGATRPLT